MCLRDSSVFYTSIRYTSFSYSREKKSRGIKSGERRGWSSPVQSITCTCFKKPQTSTSDLAISMIESQLKFLKRKPLWLFSLVIADLIFLSRTLKEQQFNYPGIIKFRQL